MKPSALTIIKAAFGIVCLTVHCEWFIYYLVLSKCDWPTFYSNIRNPTIGPNDKEVRALVFADTHLLGSKRGHWFDKLRREWQMYRAFQSAMYLHQPHVVFLLGDVTDEGEYCSEEEFDYYVKRFQSVFAVPSDTKMYVVAGNHDMGFHYRITPYLNQRFVKGFNSSSIQVISMRGNHFVLINSMALEGDGCFLCKAAELQLGQIEKTLKCLKSNATCNDNYLKTYSEPVLMMHYPLYRESDKECDEPDEAPFPLKSQKFKEGWDCLSKGSSYQLLRQIQPRLVLSGHSHHGCTRNLTLGKGIEVTIPSFSWRNKNNPSYGLFVFTPDDYGFSKCLMPQESSVIYCYIFGVIFIFFWTSYTLYVQNRKRKFKYH
ncbi:hypothetical protein FQR65_LT08343 [Abscondita terminalis]|nr:hypothetical protein FQR65_LT08343 [Abscondita terminalis]